MVMPNVIGYKDLSNLYIKPAAEPTRTISDIDLKSASEPERVLNPIVSESYMRQYIEEHGGITPTGNIEITENGENINVAPYATATVNVAGGGELDNKKLTINFVNSSLSADTFAIQIPILADNSVSFAVPTLSSEDKTVEFIIPIAAPVQPWIYTAPGYSTFTGSEAVNCQIISNEGSYAVFVTDPTADASITIQAVAGGN